VWTNPAPRRNAVPLPGFHPTMGFLGALFGLDRMHKAARLLYAGNPKAEEALASLTPQARTTALLRVARAWLADNRELDSFQAISRVLDEFPEHLEALRLKASIQMDTAPDLAVATLRKLCELRPGEEQLMLDLADSLIAVERFEDALTTLEPLREPAGPLVLLRIGKAHFAAGQTEEALGFLDAAVGQADALARSDPFAGDITAGDPQFAELQALHEEVLATLHGREAVAVDMVLRRKLDPRAGVNFKLLGASLVSSRPSGPMSLTLTSIQEERSRARKLLDHNEADARGYILLGSAELRAGDFAGAIEHFGRAEEQKPLHFAGVLGRGAALQLREQRAADNVLRRLPPPNGWQAWERVVPDLRALTTLETRVVVASAAPFRKLRPQLEGAGARIRILPIDVLATDLPELADVRGERDPEDYRSYSCLSGMTSGALAIVKVEELLDIESEGGWTFAHELAHLVFNHAPADVVRVVQRLHQRFAAVAYVGGQYQMSNVHEFFACGYVDFLRDCNGTTTYVQDDHELVRELFAVFRDLGTS
jgi:tetratricopeptide (TPR) repeat protein